MHSKDIIQDMYRPHRVNLSNNIGLFEYSECCEDYITKFVIPNNTHVTFKVLEKPVEIPLPPSYVQDYL